MNEIKECRSCKSKALSAITSLGDFYLSAFLNEGELKPPHYPLELVMCDNCTLVQLKHNIPKEELYNDNYGYKSGINNTIRADLYGVVKEIRKRVILNQGDIFLSIGENDGTLLSYCPEYVIKVGVEPIKKLAKECQQFADIVINDFWSYEAYEKISDQLQNMWKKKVSAQE